MWAPGNELGLSGLAGHSSTQWGIFTWLFFIKQTETCKEVCESQWGSQQPCPRVSTQPSHSEMCSPDSTSNSNPPRAPWPLLCCFCPPPWAAKMSLRYPVSVHALTSYFFLQEQCFPVWDEGITLPGRCLTFCLLCVLEAFVSHEEQVGGREKEEREGIFFFAYQRKKYIQSPLITSNEKMTLYFTIKISRNWTKSNYRISISPYPKEPFL